MEYHLPRRLFLTALLLTLTVGALLAPRTTHGCSCVPTQPEEERERAAAVFAGRATAVSGPSRRLVLDSSFPFIRFVTVAGETRTTFDLSTVWKGPRASTLVVESGGMCGYNFEAGRDYLVYATGTPAGTLASFCTRVLPLESAGDDVAILGEGFAPAGAAVSGAAPASRFLPVLIMTIFVSAGVLLLAAWKLNRR